MKKILTTVLLLAALTALILTGCGNNNTEDSLPEELNQFGSVAVIPSAVPSTEVAPQSSGVLAVPTTKEPGKLGETDTQGSAAPASPSPTKTPTPSYAPQPSYVPTTQPSPSPSEPLPSPPASAYTGPADKAREYIGKPLSDLFENLGYPSSADYEYIDEDDPSAGKIGTLKFPAGYTVTTKQTDESEIITAVNE